MNRNSADRLLRDLANAKPENFPGLYPELFDGDANPEETAIVLRALLRQVWSARSIRRRDWFLHEMETYYHKLRGDRDLMKRVDPAMAKGLLGDYVQVGSLLFSLREPPAKTSPLEAALLYFRRNVSRARRCPNPDCAAPHYFAKKKNQKYCSPVCAKPAQRATKRKWWRENRGK
jgi:hypothetical protein